MNIEFYHDAVCAWCYLLSARLRKLESALGVKVNHRTFVLQRNKNALIEHFGDLTSAKSQILEHWQNCKAHAEEPKYINVTGMRQQTFEYPSGYLAAKASKVAESLQGQLGHWVFFAALQLAHLHENRNIGSEIVVLDIATELGYDTKLFQSLLHSAVISEQVEFDMSIADALNIRVIPTFVVNNKHIITGVRSINALAEILSDIRKLTPLDSER